GVRRLVIRPLETRQHVGGYEAVLDGGREHGAERADHVLRGLHRHAAQEFPLETANGLRVELREGYGAEDRRNVEAMVAAVVAGIGGALVGLSRDDPALEVGGEGRGRIALRRVLRIGDGWWRGGAGALAEKLVEVRTRITAGADELTYDLAERRELP